MKWRVANLYDRADATTIQAALEKVGIEFDADGRGVRLKPAQVFREL